MASSPHRTPPAFDASAVPLRLSMGGGLRERLHRGWVFMKQSLVIWTEDRGLVVPSVLSLMSLLAFYGICYALLRPFGLWERLLSENGQEELLEYAVMIPVVLIAYVISYFYTGMTINLVDTHLGGRDARLGEAFADSIRNFGALFSLAIVSMVVQTVTARGRRAGRTAVVAVGMLEVAWRAATYLVLPVIILEDKPLRESMRRGYELHRGHFTELFVAEIGVLLVNQIIMAGATVLAIGQGVVLYFLVSPSLISIATATGLALLSIAFVFTTYLRSAYCTCLYAWAVAAEAAGEPVPPPAPLAVAMA